MESVSATELAAWLKSEQPPRLLDVRLPGEYEVARLENARLIPLQVLSTRYTELADWKDEKVVVYCHHGMRSQMAISMLESAGFENLYNLTGGIDAWSAEVDETVARY